MLPESGYVLVRDPLDRVENTRQLQALNAPDVGRVLVAITPGGTTLRNIGTDFLRALGKDPNAIGAGRNSTESWARTMIWLEVMGIRDVFVSRAHLLKPGLTADLMGLGAKIGLRLWFVAQAENLRASLESTFASWPVTEIDFGQFARHWKAAITRPQPRGPRPRRSAKRPDLPQVPLDDFTTFRAACREQLTTTEFARADAVFLAAKQHIAAWLDAAPTINEVSVATALRQLVSDCVWMPDLICRLRGAQVAALHAGYLVRVDLDAISDTTKPRVTLDEDAIRTLSIYGTPRLIAAATLMLATGRKPDELVALNLEDVAEDCATVHLGGDHAPVAIAPAARVYIQALMLERQATGAGPADPLFVYVPGTGRRNYALQRWTGRGMYDNVKRIERETGLLITSHVMSHGHTDAVAWARRRGISVLPL